MAKKDIQRPIIQNEENEIDELEQFIKKKKIQNEALKKIIEKINTTQEKNTKKS